MTYERLIEQPDETFGIPIDQDNWRFIVEMLLPETGASLWGQATWNGATGNGVWSSSVWTDITRSVAGITWRRGSEQFGDRPRTGVLNMTLRVRGGDWSPFGTSAAKAYYTPGTLVRVSCFNANGNVLLEPFDNFTDAPWTLTGTPTIVAGRTGTAAQITGTTARADYSFASSASDTVTTGFAWQAPTFINSIDVVSFYGDANTVRHVRLVSQVDGSFVFLRDTIGLSGAFTAAGAVAAGTWYYLEVQTKIHDSTGFVRLRVNGIEVISVTGLDTRNTSANATVDAVRLGPQAVGSPTELYDDLYLSTGAGVSFRGDQTIEDTTDTRWVPQIVGLVESWPETFGEKETISTVEVTAVETTAFLAQIDNNAVALVGSGDLAYTRINRLLEAAEWPYGLVQEFGKDSSFPLQSTDMANNRLGECHLTADSTDTVFYSHRSGVGLIRTADPRSRYWSSTIRGNPVFDDAARAIYPERLEFNPGATASAAPWFDLGDTETVSVPDAANLDFTGDFAVAVELVSAPSNLGGIRSVVGKWGAAAADKAWLLEIGATNIPTLNVSNPAGVISTYTSTFPLPIATTNVFPIEIGVAFESSAAYAGFYYRYGGDRGAWAALPVAGVPGGALTVRTGAATVDVGDAVAYTGLAARYGRVRIWDVNGGGTPPAMPDDDVAPVVDIRRDDIAVNPSTASSFTCATGQTVTITGTGVLAAQTGVKVYAPEDIVFANDREAMVNDVRYARAGGSEVAVEDAYSIGRWRSRITASRSDLLNNDDADVTILANRLLERRSRVTLRPTTLTVVARPGHTASNLPALFVLDVGDVVTVCLPNDAGCVVAAIAAVNHDVALGGWWKSTFTFDVFSEII